MKTLKPNVGWLVPLLAVMACFLLYKLDPLPLQVLRNTAFDQYQRWSAKSFDGSQVRIIDIDNESLAKLGQWPWPRTRIAELVARLQDAGAASIAFDVVFAEPDRTSPGAMLQTWGVTSTLRNSLASLPDHDAVLAETISRGKVVLGHVPQSLGPPAEDFVYNFEMNVKGPSPLAYLHGFSGTIAALQELQIASAGNGAFSFIPDSDGVVRRVPMLLRMGEEIVPSLSAEALRVALNEPGYIATVSEERGAGMESIGIGKFTIPTTAEGEIWVRFSKEGHKRYIPAWKVLSGDYPLDSLRDKIVVLGTSAPGLLDLRYSPLGGIIPGVEVHALALEQILSGDPIFRPNWASNLELMIIVVGGLVVGFTALSAGAIPSAILFGLTMVAASWGGWLAFSNHGLLFDPVTPGTALLLVFGVTSLHHHIVSERKQRWVKEAFARYVSPNLVSYLVEHPDYLNLGGSRRECSFIFTDLAGFTSLMEKLDPNVAVSLLNEYLDRMINIAFEHEGTLDRIVGDAVAIMFSAPVEQPDHRQRAVRCAEAMHAFGNQYAAAARERGVAFGITRIGVHTGEVTVGNFGGATIFDYRALGDPVNTASRLESVNKQLGTQVCLSEATLSGSPDTPTRPVGKLVLKGKSLPLLVHQPLFSAELDKIAPPEDYLSAYQQMKDNDPDAEQSFKKLIASWPEDPLLNFHLNRFAKGQTGDTIVFTEK